MFVLCCGSVIWHWNLKTNFSYHVIIEFLKTCCMDWYYMLILYNIMNSSIPTWVMILNVYIECLGRPCFVNVAVSALFSLFFSCLHAWCYFVNFLLLFFLYIKCCEHNMKVFQFVFSSLLLQNLYWYMII